MLRETVRKVANLQPVKDDELDIVVRLRDKLLCVAVGRGTDSSRCLRQADQSDCAFVHHSRACALQQG